VGGWRRLRNEEHHNFYASPNITRVIKSSSMRWAGNVTRMGEMRSVCKIYVGIPEGKRSRGRPRHRWEDNITVDRREIESEDTDWIHLAQDRDCWQALFNTAMYFRVP
jgi:hypothetical protein